MEALFTSVFNFGAGVAMVLLTMFTIRHLLTVTIPKKDQEHQALVERIVAVHEAAMEKRFAQYAAEKEATEKRWCAAVESVVRRLEHVDDDLKIVADDLRELKAALGRQGGRP